VPSATLEILDPTGNQSTATEGRTAVHTQPRARLTGLDGLRLALLDNTKTNARQLLDEIAAELGRRYDLASVTVFRKAHFSTPAGAEQLEEIARSADCAIAGVGDCGSCSAATVADGILLERAGVPAASICSDAFIASSRVMATVYGVPEYRFAAVRHPVSYLGPEQLRDRAGEIVPEILGIFGVGG
jgi:hypothetical protein